MAKLFYDHLIFFEEIDVLIKKHAKTHEEKEEMRNTVEEIIQHKVFDSILNRLPVEHHQEFLEHFHSRPHDEVFLIGYLKDRVGDDIEENISKDLENLKNDLLSYFTQSG